LQLAWRIALVLAVSAAAVLVPASRVSARDKSGVEYGMGLIVNVPFTESELEQVVQDVAQDGIIRGTKEYNKDEYVADATAVPSTKAFPRWIGPGKVFYKVRLQALDPRNFKDSGDVGTLAVRYVVQPQGDKNSILQINAVFVEDFRRVSHPSNGSVESAEYKDIHDRLDAIASMKEETAELLREKQGRGAQSSSRSGAMDEQPALTPATPAGRDSQTINNEASASQASDSQRSGAQTNFSPAGDTQASDSPTNGGHPPEAQTPEERLHYLRQQVVRLVKSPGAPLKTAPFHTASTLQTLASGTEVLIVVATPYWLGVETHEGQHGWMLRDQLEQVP
jgi:hypothetical protein